MNSKWHNVPIRMRMFNYIDRATIMETSNRELTQISFYSREAHLNSHSPENTPIPCDQAVQGGVVWELELLKVLRADAAQSSAWPGAGGLTMDSGAWTGTVAACSLSDLLWTSVQDAGPCYKLLCRTWGKAVFCGQLRALTLSIFWGEARKMQQKFKINSHGHKV